MIDTTAWVEFLRDTGSPVCQRVDDLLVAEIATCDVVRMEVLSGARDEQHLQQLRRLLARASSLPTQSVDYDAAAALYRTCRQKGQTVRKLIDCLIAAVAIRDDVPILHRDVDFDVLSRHTALRVDAVSVSSEPRGRLAPVSASRSALLNTVQLLFVSAGSNSTLA